ncbi:protein kinase [Paenibacillus sp. PL2-23]|uniref:serine/threonine protein kinase n=1 Tax=Paenibacillus sp. PL2-23 TaxID=2100729 RepID=UPI0030F512A8
MMNRIITRWRGMMEAWRDYPLQQGAVWNGRYRVDRLLGMGSYGQAYVCRDLESGAVVLLKRNKPSKGQVGIELLRRENAIMEQLSHPQIPVRIAYSKRRRDEAIIMEYVEGFNLEHAIYEQKMTFDAREALSMLQQLLGPLRYLHAQGFVHRDVRIPNVLLQDGVLHLVDFGLACRVGEELPPALRDALGEGEAMAAQSAAAVKHRMRGPYPSSDWFGLGHLFLFVMYSGYEHPEGAEEGTWMEELRLEPEIEQFVAKLLQDEPAWQSTEQCEEELISLLHKLRQAH